MDARGQAVVRHGAEGSRRGFGRELCSVTYALDSSGRIVAEPKSEMKKRGLRSPDLADALGVTFAPGKRANKAIVQAYRGGF